MCHLSLCDPTLLSTFKFFQKSAALAFLPLPCLCLPPFFYNKIESILTLFLLDIPGNILVIATLISKRKQLSSTNSYLVTLAVADFVVCFIGQMCRAFPRALTGFDTGIQSLCFS